MEEFLWLISLFKQLDLSYVKKINMFNLRDNILAI